jgi:hypothetical protein
MFPDPVVRIFCFFCIAIIIYRALFNVHRPSVKQDAAQGDAARPFSEGDGLFLVLGAAAELWLTWTPLAASVVVSIVKAISGVDDQSVDHSFSLVVLGWYGVISVAICWHQIALAQINRRRAGSHQRLLSRARDCLIKAWRTCPSVHQVFLAVACLVWVWVIGRYGL